jgi:uncharacterized protein (TIGR02246 family)
MKPMPSRLLPALALFAVGSLVGACAQEPAMPPDTTAEDTVAIGELRGAWDAAYEAGDAAALAGLYTTDAVLMQPGLPTMTGRAAIESHYGQGFAQGSFTVDIRPGSTVVDGDIGYEHGQFTGTMTPAAEGDPRQTEGRYVVMLRRDTDGAWRIARSMSNAATPEMMKIMLDTATMAAQEGGGS